MKEMEEMVNNGVLRRKYGGSKQVSPIFVIPKKDNRIRTVSDFREVNMLIKRKPYPMLRIHEIMQKRSSYTHFTKMDLSMKFYCFELDEESKKCTTIITPDDQDFEYNRLLMGIKISPNEAQAITEEIIQGSDVTCCIDDLGICSNGTFDEDLGLVNKVLQWIAESNL